MAKENQQSSSKLAPSKEQLKVLEELMSNGKRNYVCGEYETALDFFADACSEMATVYGQLADECAEPYLYYGKTLLERARLENGVLGHAVKETPVFGEEGTESETTEAETKTDEEDDGMTKEDIRDAVQASLRDDNMYNDSTEEELTADETDETENNKIISAGEGSSTKLEETKTEAEETKTEAKEDVKEVEQVEDVQGEEDEEEDIDVDDVGLTEEEEDVSSMQLAWEMFELSAFICNRQVKRGKTDSNAKSHLAEAKYGLAQISLETEHYENAVKDFTECLNLYTATLEDKNDRRLAEVNYNIALALSFDKKFDKALEKYKCAIKILEDKISDLETKVKDAEEKGGKGKASSELEEWTKEMNELKDIVILDMMAKVEDAEEMIKQAEASAQVIKAATKEIFSSIGTSTSFDAGFDDAGFDKPCEQTTGGEVVHDITNKVRSKRKNEDVDVVESKKVKQDDKHENTKENGGLAAAES